VNALNLEIEELSTELNDLSHFVYTLSGSVQQLILNDLSDELYDLSGRTDLLATDLASLEIRVQGISEEVDVILPDVLGLSGRVEGLSDRVEGLSLELDTRQNDFAGLSGDLYILESQVLDLSSYVYNLPQSVPTLDGVLTAGNDANGLGILNAGDITATSFLSSSGSLSANDTTLYLDSANGSTPGLTGTGGIVEAYSTLNPSISKNLLLNSQYGGNVGIRTNNPSYPLDVSGNTRILGNTYNQGKVAIGLTPGSTIDNDLTIQGVIQITNIGGIGLNEKYAIYSFDNKLQLNPRTSTGAYRSIDGFIMDSSGRISIGKQTPTTTLDLNGNFNMAFGTRTNIHPIGLPFYATGNIESESSGFQFGHNNGTTGVGIGFNSVYMAGSGANLPMNITTKGTGGIFFRPGAITRAQINQNGTINFNNYLNGTLSITAGGLVVSSSDKRAKKNIEYIDLSGLELVNKIKPARFQYNHEEHDYHTGFIADQLIEAGLGFCVDGKKYEYELITEDVSGENFYDRKTIIKTNPDGTPMLDYSKPRMKGLDQCALIAVLVKAVQELSKEVEELKSRI
jgi:hypothetical protein